jgi:hypothetical protein
MSSLEERKGETHMTIAQAKRATDMFCEYAKEPVVVDEIASALYVYGSELACLRIFAKYQTNGAFHNPAARVGYSKNMNTHYFVLDNIDRYQ